MTIQDVARHFTEVSADRPEAFDEMASVVYAFQQANNRVLARYCTSINVDTAYAYLPVAAFKYAPVTSFPFEEAEHVFESSGTGRGVTSKHYVCDLAVYERAVTTHFEQVFGPGPFTLVAHLPHYAERGATSSLLYMVALLIRRYGDDHSGFVLDDRMALEKAVKHSISEHTSFLLFGAAFGLLDLVEEDAVTLPSQARVIETGGMKTYRREISREVLHRQLAEGFGLAESQIWSEYGMCELMSQCYTRGESIFYPPPWMRFRVVDPEQPDRAVREGESGALAFFDLANLYSVSAILTEDRAVRRRKGFEVLGRLSQAELRGCNFLLESEQQAR
ncbi:MAG: acyl transferase [Rhodothermales bacterium]